jgi:hypothetical protein
LREIDVMTITRNHCRHVKFDTDINNKHAQQCIAEHYTQINNYIHSSVRNFEATCVEFYVDKPYVSSKRSLRPYDNHDDENGRPLHTRFMTACV